MLLIGVSTIFPAADDSVNSPIADSTEGVVTSNPAGLMMFQYDRLNSEKSSRGDSERSRRRPRTPDSPESRITSSPVAPMEDVRLSPLVVETPLPLTHVWRIDSARMLAAPGSITVRPLVDQPNRKPASKKGKKNLLRHIKVSSWYFAAMPTLGYQRIAANTNDNVLIKRGERTPAFSSDRLGVRLEAGMEGPVAKRWKAFAGILYFQRKQTISYVETYVDTLIASTGPGGTGILAPQLNYLDKSANYEIKNAGLRFGLSYQLFRNKPKRSSKKYPDILSGREIPGTQEAQLIHEVGAGVELQTALNNTRRVSRTHAFNDPSVYAFLSAYYRLQYPQRGRLRAVFQPTVDYSFYINKDVNAPFYVKPFGLGLNFGCLYHL